NIPPR
ncbi:hypothetical protein CFOL_v3_33153, partial [Cephalotus follicularis]